LYRIFSVRVVENTYDRLSGYEARKAHYDHFKENVLITSYAPVRVEYEAVARAMGPNFMVILDECTYFKGRKTETNFACKYIAEQAKRAYGLSAAIIKNGLEEVWGIYDVIVPGLFWKITKFRDTFCQQEMMELMIKGKRRKIPKTVGYKNLAQFKAQLDPYFLLRRKEEVASELPKLISKKIILEMGDEQKHIYKEAVAGILYEEKIKQEFFEVMDKIRNGVADEKTLKLYEERKEKYEKFLSPEGKKRGKLAAVTYCQMISNGPALVKRPGESSKEEEFERLMLEELSNEKVILFTRYASGIPFLEIVCERKHIGYVKITGEQSSKERTEARIKFQTDPKCNLIFITTAGSEALNLQSASTIIFYDTPWSYGDLVQTIGRAQRIGSIQDHILLIHLVNKGTIDVRVINKVSEKKDLSTEILGDTSEGALDFTKHDLDVVDDLYDSLLKDFKEND
jgi:SNF2 family DNA or RNA helicase